MNVLRTWKWFILLSFTLVKSGHGDDSTSGNDYLQSTMLKIQQEREGTLKTVVNEVKNKIKATASKLVPDVQPAESNHVMAVLPASGYGGPSEDLSLSKDQLLNLYKAAIQTGAQLDFSKLLGSASHNAPIHTGDKLVPYTDKGQIPGYYYYFYPIKSFLNQHHDDKNHHMIMGGHHMMSDETQMAGSKVPKAVEPLFAAMAGFVGVAMMFIMSILFLPKFGKLTSRRILLKQGTEDLNVFTKLVFESVEGKDCSKRIVCEVGKTLRTMKMGTNGIRILELLLPEKLGKQLARIRRSASKKEKCAKNGDHDRRKIVEAKDRC